MGVIANNNTPRLTNGRRSLCVGDQIGVLVAFVVVQPSSAHGEYADACAAANANA